MARTLYISGPIGGQPGNNNSAFDDAAGRLQRAGYTTINPLDANVDIGGLSEADAWLAYLLHDLTELAACNGVALLDGWEKSHGAIIEIHAAHRLHKRVAPVDYWTRLANWEELKEAAQ